MEKLAYELDYRLSRAALRTVCIITIFQRLSKPSIPVKGLTTMCIVATKNGAATTKGRVMLVSCRFFAPSGVCFLLGDRISTLLRDVR